MLRLWKKDKNKDRGDPVRDRAAKWMAHKIVGGQLRITRKLRQWEGKLDYRAKKILLMLFALLWAAGCCYIFFDAIFRKGTPKIIKDNSSLQRDTIADPLIKTDSKNNRQ